MHPAFSVIFFSTRGGAGPGGRGGRPRGGGAGGPPGGPAPTPAIFLVALVLATVLVTVGLLSSLGHLGRPARAWRAFSQWRTSWLSREGVAAVFTFMPLVVLLATLSSAWWPAPLDGEAFAPGAALPWFARLSLAGAFLGAVATVACTAMIYASLKPIPAWRHRAVLPVYAGFALLTGGLLLATLLAAGGDRPALVEAGALVGLLLAVALAVGKRRYWRDIDRGAMPASRASALGLPADRVATVFERPHTEANYLTKEMGFVVARRHARRLRQMAVALFGVMPAVLCAGVLVAGGEAAALLLALASIAALLGALVERWLFFAEAKHLVMTYYQ